MFFEIQLKGGTMVIAYEYVRNMNGISSALKYPYKGDDIYDCSYNSLNSVGPGVIDFTVLPAGNIYIYLITSMD